MKNKIFCMIVSGLILCVLGFFCVTGAILDNWEEEAIAYQKYEDVPLIIDTFPENFMQKR